MKRNMTDRQREIRDWTFCILLLLTAFSWFHWRTRGLSGDTAVFLDYLERMTIPELLKDRMANVTTRVILEAVLFVFLSLPDWCFWIANTGMIVLSTGFLGYYAAAMGGRCFGKDRSLWPMTLAAFLFLLYPFENLAVAGIPGTSINYIWSGAMGMLSFWPFATALSGKDRPAWWQWAGALLCGAVAGNMEQAAVFLFLLETAGLILLLRWKRNRPMAWILWIETIVSLGFHLTGGNQNRMHNSIAAYWPEFADLSLIQKGWNGYAAAVNGLLSTPDLIFLAFALLLAMIAVTAPQKRRLWYPAGLIPLLYEGLVIGFKVLTVLTGRDFLRWLNGVEDLSTGAPACPAGLWLPILLQTAVLISAIWFLFLIEQPLFWKLTETGILAAGFATRAMMGFSPTLYESHMRTAHYFYLAILAVTLMLSYELGRRSERRYRLYGMLIAVMGILNLIRMTFKIEALIFR